MTLPHARASSRFLLSLSLGLLAAGCGTVAASGPTAAKDDKSATGQAQRDLIEARARLAAVESKRTIEIANAEAELLAAQRGRTDAEQVLLGVPKQAALAVEEAQIERDESAYRADEAKAELLELEAMYQADEFAKMTKELVLQRGRRALEIAERRLQARTRKLTLLQEVTQAEQLREQQSKVAAAAAAVQKAERALQRTRTDGDLEVLAAKHAVAKAEAEASK